ncbi:hypothetical protein A3D84_03005 [Candidatus Woesebacteria bacterium RIFCSPHIGHO2_02_FULL_42_20]|uniref:HD domain-containing protein n=1 Tax=Candidatus Woesebacteria bacterium RIFCSPHIGHO2_12_FULL_41_24 TaxID=1802510 RepID=A0A1F8ASG0_9BACT|nr:MAG: hypothetical protein A2W15_03195 [Candidatus Woesebacteria bacterium RBG_16_41_13]OGM30546.1 MAG: hypothetical protein A2873_05505 [Candidatus Woesebacteria bacterium RIFCSPHIGHO2_01_FULL_42_80]OGM34810.1 MAG: hypothetical protein A3D84_03005 [Candidatus Woesebacteria bacterium RIFCSPHIGHO2_02_FULL_42_20]OGM54439.1 MAG: hypothetical protein A3E44_00040 [Candidatus Woesebacteria bacterium RIFCSPHIGHO2_12_FULL_41_24]OGM68059.1 MAG: hypothetical protein A2969_05125 [Candidatus Woesebacteri
MSIAENRSFFASPEIDPQSRLGILNMNDDDLTGQVLQAYKVAESAHRGQRRFSDEPYINHCLATLRILEAMGIEDSEMLMAALLHDVVEDDTGINLAALEQEFGNSVAQLVDGVTKLHTGDQETAEALRVVSLSYLEPKVAILKLADRLHNMMTLGSVPDNEKRI